MPVLDKEQAQEALSKSQTAFIGTWSGVGQCLTTCSDPPTHNYIGVKFDNVRPLRGLISSTEFSYSQKGKDTSTYRSYKYSDGTESKPELVATPDPKYPHEGQLYLVILSDTNHIQDLVEIDNSMMNDLVRSA